MTSRRSFLTGLTGFIACAPAIVRASSLMPVKPLTVFGDEIWNAHPWDGYVLQSGILTAAHLRRAQGALNRNYRLMLEDCELRLCGPVAERLMELSR